MKIVNLPSAAIAAAKKIHISEVAFNELLTGTNRPLRHELVDSLVRDPSAEKMSALVLYDETGKTLESLQRSIMSSNLSPLRIYGAQLNEALSAPLRAAIDEMQVELTNLDATGAAACEKHRLDYQPGPDARHLAERIAVAEESFRQLSQGMAVPLKFLARLGYALDSTVNADELSENAILAHRNAVKSAKAEAARHTVTR